MLATQASYDLLQRSLSGFATDLPLASVAGIGSATTVRSIAEEWDRRFPHLKDKILTAFSRGTNDRFLREKFDQDPKWTNFFYTMALLAPGTLPWITTWSGGSWPNQRLPAIIDEANKRLDIRDKLFELYDKRRITITSHDLDQIADPEALWQDIRDKFQRVKSFDTKLTNETRGGADRVWNDKASVVGSRAWVAGDATRVFMVAALASIAPDLLFDLYVEKSRGTIANQLTEWVQKYDEAAKVATAALFDWVKLKPSSSGGTTTTTAEKSTQRTAQASQQTESTQRAAQTSQQAESTSRAAVAATGTEAAYLSPAQKAEMQAQAELAAAQASSARSVVLIGGAVVVVVLLAVGVVWAVMAKAGGKGQGKAKTRAHWGNR